MNKFKAASKLLQGRALYDSRLTSLFMKTVENLMAERAGAPAPHDDSEIYREVQELRTLVNEVLGEATDETALLIPDAFPGLQKNGELIRAGTRINWKGELKRAAVNLYDTVENNPDNAPNLWENVDYKNNYRVIPETLSVGDAFSEGEKGYWKDKLYVSLINNNVWNPEQYPAGWSEVTE